MRPTGARGYGPAPALPTIHAGPSDQNLTRGLEWASPTGRAVRASEYPPPDSGSRGGGPESRAEGASAPALVAPPPRQGAGQAGARGSSLRIDVRRAGRNSPRKAWFFQREGPRLSARPFVLENPGADLLSRLEAVSSAPEA